MTHVHLLTIGEELLIGSRTNSHLSYLGNQLYERGLILESNHTVLDDPECIAAQVVACAETGDLIFTTGGLGPTTDDCTREGVAKALGIPLHLDSTFEASLKKTLHLQGRKMTPFQQKQCYRFPDSEFLPNAVGTAPGLYLTHRGKIFILLPGPTHELVPMFEQEVLPRLQKAGVLTEPDTVQLRTYGIHESELQEKLAPLFAQYPVKVAFCAHHGLIDIRLRPHIPPLIKACTDILGKDLIGRDDCSLAQEVLTHLKAHNQTLATAEFCTGGLLSSTLAVIPEASAMFSGGITCHCNEAIKKALGVPEITLEQYGNTSAETAVAMAIGAAKQFSSDSGLSITGSINPKTTSTLHFGWASKGQVSSHTLHCPENYSPIQAVNEALDWLRRKLTSKHVV